VGKSKTLSSKAGTTGPIYGEQHLCPYCARRWKADIRATSCTRNPQAFLALFPFRGLADDTRETQDLRARSTSSRITAKLRLRWAAGKRLANSVLAREGLYAQAL
jgi:hypothetical protein